MYLYQSKFLLLIFTVAKLAVYNGIDSARLCQFNNNIYKFKANATYKHSEFCISYNFYFVGLINIPILMLFFCVHIRTSSVRISYLFECNPGKLQDIYDISLGTHFAGYYPNRKKGSDDSTE